MNVVPQQAVSGPVRVAEAPESGTGACQHALQVYHWSWETSHQHRRATLWPHTIRVTVRTTRAVLKCSVGKCWTGRDEVLAWSNRGVVELLDRSNSGAGALLDPLVLTHRLTLDLSP